jgi:hypothetical protein
MLVWEKARFRAVDAQLERNELVKLINKNGIEIHNSARHVLEEVMRGTGCVMGEKMSIFIENVGITEKYIVVSRTPDSEGGGMTQKFPSSNFKDAWELFIK